MRNREFASLGVEMAEAKVVEGRTLEGYLSAFNYPIDESWGRQKRTLFMRPGMWNKTLQENRDQIQMLVNHGMGRYDIPIGVWTDLEPDARGLYGRGTLHDGPANQDVIAALAAGALRAMSVQFEVTDDSFNEDRTERYIHAAKLYEGGPVTFPKNLGATASLHSMAQMATLLAEEEVAEKELHEAVTNGLMSRDEARALLDLHWDGAAAMRSASSAAEFRKIAFERANDSDPDTAAHWALPHHPSPGADADPAGVAAALAALHGGRGGAPDLKNSAAAESHLNAHRAEASSQGAGTKATPEDDRLTRIRYELHVSESSLKEAEDWLAREEKANERTGAHADPS